MTHPKITLTAGTSPTEGTISTYLITLDTSAPVGGLTVDYNISESSATLNKDYEFTAGENLTGVTENSFTIAPGAKTATLNLVAIADTVVDPNESVVVNLTTGSGYELVSTDTQFVHYTAIAVGNFPVSVISADFNNDGNVDLATANQWDASVSTLFGNSSGGFTGNTEVAVGYGPDSIISADFDGDGNTDLATANIADNTVSVLLGNGSGDFFTGTTIAVDSYPKSIISADFNDDGNADLATANMKTDTVSVRLGDGSGGFTGNTEVVAWPGSLGDMPNSVTSADFNGDDNADLAIAFSRSDGIVSILLGNGSGGFTGNTTVVVGNGSCSVISPDFNSDGNADLATANYADNTVSVLLGNGNGGFTGDISIAVDKNPASVISADFNGDGNPDFATANYRNNTVSVRLGDGRGNFTGNTAVVVGNGPCSVISADFNDDDHADLVTANLKDDNVSVLLNTGNATSAEMTIVDDGLYLPQNLYGDVNGSKNDVLTGRNGADNLYGRDMADTLSGGIGNDSLWGGQGIDSLLGGLGNDWLSGGWDNDTLNGGNGYDILIGGIGHDVLTGGAGSDTFNFINKPIAANTDRITDFSVADDTIQLASSQFTQLTATGVLNADNFVNGATANDANDYVIYNPATGALLYDADGSGAGVGLRIALLGVDLALTNADFVIS